MSPTASPNDRTLRVVTPEAFSGGHESLDPRDEGASNDSVATLTASTPANDALLHDAMLHEDAMGHSDQSTFSPEHPAPLGDSPEQSNDPAFTQPRAPRSITIGQRSILVDSQSVVSFLVLAIGTLIVIWKMHAFKLPSQIAAERAVRLNKTAPHVNFFSSLLDWITPWRWGRGDMLKATTATGGDMGAHVWSADFVTRGLFPKGRLTGWSDDWMYGIPVLNFYFPLPTLTIGVLGKIIGPKVAFKIITAIGIFTLPVAAWGSGKFAKLPRPIPTLMGLMAFIFLFGRNYDLFIYGGNVLSTMAGEFSFSISLSLATLFIGMYINVLKTGTHRGRTAIVLAATGLCHLLPTMWAVLASVVMSVAFLDATKLRARNINKLGPAVLGAAVASLFFGLISGLITALVFFLGVLFVLALIDQIATVRNIAPWQFNLPQIRDSLLTLGCGGAIAGFWLVPFSQNLDYTNDMGWEKSLRYIKFLFPFWAGKGLKPPADSGLIAVAMIFALIGALVALGSLARAMIRRAQGFGNWSPYSGPLSVIVSTIFGMTLGMTKGTWQAGVLGVCGGLIVSFFVVIILSERNALQSLVLGGTVLLLTSAAVASWGLRPEFVVYASIPLIFTVLILAAINKLDYERWAVGLTTVIAASAALFTLSPQFRLWNARVLPFWFWSILMLAAYGAVKAVAMIKVALHWYSEPRRTFRNASSWGIASVAAFVFVGVGLPLELVPGNLPIPRVNKGAIGVQLAGKSSDSNQATGWSGYNYKGYEGQPAWPEYKALMDEAGRVGREHGCGRAIYEYEDTKLGSFGTTLSPMLLPMWTKGCIGSIEGVYFESSASMPFHWMNADLVTAPTTNDDKGNKKYSGPSNPQRDLPYQSFNLARGVQKLQQSGVRYYFAITDVAKEAAAKIPDLSEVGKSGSFTIYKVANSEIVSPLTEEPVVVKGVDGDQYGGWLDVEMEWYTKSDQYPQTMMWSGPGAWQRVVAKVKKPMTKPTDPKIKPEKIRTFGAGVTFQNGAPVVIPVTDPPTQPPAYQNSVPTFQRKTLPAAKVTNIKKSNVDITFTVDQIGVPILVKASYFPNWTVEGAKGPYRAMPNFMVVVPTSKNVHLHYGYSKFDAVGYLATILGLIGLFVLHFTRKPRKFLVPHPDDVLADEQLAALKREQQLDLSTLPPPIAGTHLPQTWVDPRHDGQIISAPTNWSSSGPNGSRLATTDSTIETTDAAHDAAHAGEPAQEPLHEPANEEPAESHVPPSDQLSVDDDSEFRPAAMPSDSVQEVAVQEDSSDQEVTSLKEESSDQQDASESADSIERVDPAEHTEHRGRN
jgi:hypothetical protein